MLGSLVFSAVTREIVFTRFLFLICHKANKTSFPIHGGWILWFILQTKWRPFNLCHSGADVDRLHRFQKTGQELYFSVNL